MDNYKDTAFRMYEDAHVLHDRQRWFACCYLSGYVVECYAKLIIDNAISLGAQTNYDTVRRYGHNIGVMNQEILSSVLSLHQLTKYCIDFNIECNTVLNWDPNKRYNSNDFEWNQKITADNFFKEVEIIMEQIKNMQLDGVI